MRSLYIYLGLCSSQICEKKRFDYNKQIKQKGRKKTTKQKLSIETICKSTFSPYIFIPFFLYIVSQFYYFYNFCIFSFLYLNITSLGGKGGYWGRS